MLSASVGRDSCQRISAESLNANSVNFRNKSECAAIMLSMQHGRRQLEPGPVKEIAGVCGENRMVNLWLRLREYRTSRFLRPEGTSPKDLDKYPATYRATASQVFLIGSSSARPKRCLQQVSRNHRHSAANLCRQSQAFSLFQENRQLAVRSPAFQI